MRNGTNEYKIPWKAQKICRGLRIEENNGIASQTLGFNSKILP